MYVEDFLARQEMEHRISQRLKGQPKHVVVKDNDESQNSLLGCLRDIIIVSAIAWVLLTLIAVIAIYLFPVR